MVNVNNLANEIVKQLKAYTEEVKEEIQVAKEDVSKQVQRELKNVNIEQTGSYKKGWRIKKEKKSYKVHNKTDYQLTHLLEKGHAKRNGGRVAPRVHIAPAEERAIKKFESRVKKAIKPT